MKMTRRRGFGLLAAAATGVSAGLAAAAPPREEVFTLIRSGSAVIVKNASGDTVYVKAGSTERGEGTASPLSALVAAVRSTMEDGISQVRVADQPLPGGRG